MADGSDVWPINLKVAEKGTVLEVAFEDGSSFKLPAEYLRVMSPSAEVQGHSRHERKTLGGKRNVFIIGIERIGSYAVRLTFDDTHGTGIFTWAYLHILGSRYPILWADYLAELEKRGLSRDVVGQSVGF